MKRIKITLTFMSMLALAPSLRAQNLVPNPGFEDMVACPDGYDEMSNATGWSSFRESTDYFNTCATISAPDFGVPDNFTGSQLAQEGNGYGGFITYVAGIESREMLGRQLFASLVVGQKYYASFYVVNAGHPNIFGTRINGCTNKIGMRFSIHAYSYSDPVPIDNSAQVYTNTIIADTVNWQKITGSFVADSAYQYFSIGNFFDDAHTDTSTFYGGGCVAYYLVDEVKVSTDSAYVAATDAPMSFVHEEVMVYPNPASEHFQIKNITGDYVVWIQNMTGQTCHVEKINGAANIDTSSVPNGWYVVRIFSGLKTRSLLLAVQHP